MINDATSLGREDSKIEGRKVSATFLRAERRVFVFLYEYNKDIEPGIY